MFEPLDLFLPTGVSFEQRLVVYQTLRRCQCAQKQKATASSSQTTSSSSSPSAWRVDTPEIARTQDCSRDATQQPLSPIGYYQGEDDEEEVLSPPPDVALSTFPPDEDINSAFASISIGLDGEISDVEEEAEEDQVPSSSSTRGKFTSRDSSSSSRSSGAVGKHGSYGALVLQKKLSKAPPAAAPPPVADKRVHAGTQQWLKAAYLSLGFCTLVVSPQTRKRVVCTVAQDIASRLPHEGLAHRAQPPLLALRNSPDLKPRGALVVTSSKAAAEEWCQEFRAHAHVRLLGYVDSIAQRRAAQHRLRGHDVVVTTFDVLKAIEVGLPQESEQAREEKEGEWLGRRPPPVGPVVQGSLLHLLRFRDLVLDFHELASSVKMTNKRGAAARLVAAELRCSLVPAAELSAGNDVYLSAAVRNAREVMGCPGAIIASSITLDAHL